MVLLTPKEISVCYEVSENDARVATIKEWATARRAVDVAITKAQLKKVVEYVGGYGGSHSKGLYVFAIPSRDWQALLKEVE